MNRIRTIIALILITSLSIPMEIFSADFGDVEVKLVFTDFEGTPITYNVGGKIYDENANPVAQVYGDGQIATLKAFRSYKIELILYTDNINAENNPRIIRTFKTRGGFKTVTVKLPNKIVLNWKVQLTEKFDKVIENAYYSATVTVKDADTNKLVAEQRLRAGTGTIPIPPGLYNITITDENLQEKSLSRFPIFKERTSHIRVECSDITDLILVFSSPLKYPAKIRTIGPTPLDQIIPAGTESEIYNIKAGIYDIEVQFNVDIANDIVLGGTYKNQYKMESTKVRSIRLSEDASNKYYSEYDKNREKVRVEICSTDAGNKTITITDPVTNILMGREDVDTTGCVRFAGENGELTVNKYERIKVKIENKDSGKVEERTVPVREAITMGNNSTADSMEKIVSLDVLDATTKLPIPEWKGTIRRLSDGEFFGVTSTNENGESETQISSLNAMIYLPAQSSLYEIEIRADGYMQEIKRIRSFAPRLVSFHMTKSNQLKTVTLNLEAASDNKNLIMKDITIYASYYAKDSADTLYKQNFEIGDSQVPIEAVNSVSPMKWSINVRLPENKTVYLKPEILFESNLSSFIYIVKPQKCKVKPLTEAETDEINIPITVIGTDHKILVMEKQGREKDFILNAPIEVSQSYHSDAKYGVNNFSMEAEIASDQPVWIPDGIFVAASASIRDRDINKLVEQECGDDLNCFDRPTHNRVIKQFKTPLDYDKGKYEMPAVILSYQRSFQHQVNLLIDTRYINTDALLTAGIPITSQKIKITSADKSYTDSMPFEKGRIIAGLPRAGRYDVEYTINYKVPDGEKTIYNSKGEVWKIIPVYKRKTFILKETVALPSNGGATEMKFLGHLSLEKMNIVSYLDGTISDGINDANIYSIPAQRQQCILTGDYKICGTSKETISCGGEQITYVKATDVRPATEGDKLLDRNLRPYSIPADGYEVYSGKSLPESSSQCPVCPTMISLTDYSFDHSKFAKLDGQPYMLMLSYITQAECVTMTHVTGPYETVEYTFIDGSKDTGGSEWYVNKHPYKTVADFDKGSEKKITVRLRNRDANQVFPLSTVYIDPSKKTRNNATNEEEPTKIYKNTYVEFIVLDNNGNFTDQTFKKVWIDRSVSNVYQKSWYLPVRPDKRVWVRVVLPERFGSGTGSVYHATAEAGHATVDIDRNPDWGQINLSPGERVSARVSGVIDGDTIEVTIQGSQEVIRLSGITCPATNTECMVASKAFAQKKLDPGSFVEIALNSTERDNYGRLTGKIYINGADFGQELLDAGLVANFKPSSDKDFYKGKTVNLLVKAYAGNNKTFAGKRVYVAVNPDRLPTVRKFTQGSDLDAYAYWGGIKHELKVDAGSPSQTEEITIAVEGEGGNNVKLLFYTSDLDGFIEKSWLPQLLKTSLDGMQENVDKAMKEFSLENLQKSAYLKDASFATTVKNVTLTAANYQQVKATIPTLSKGEYQDWINLTLSVNATSTEGFRANLIDLTAAASIIKSVDIQNSKLEEFKNITKEQRNAMNWRIAHIPATLTGDYYTHEGKRYKVLLHKNAGIWKTEFYDMVLKKTYSETAFMELATRNMKLLSTMEKAAKHPIMKVAKALTLQPFTKWLGQAFGALGKWGEMAYRNALILGMGLPLSGMPLVKIQTSMDAKTEVMEAVGASTHFQVVDWFRNFFNKPLVAKTLSVSLKVRKGGKIIVRAAAMGHEPYTSIIPVTAEMFENESADISMPMKTNLMYTYSDWESFMNSFPLLQERIEEFWLAPEMYATTSERASLMEYMTNGIGTMIESFLKDFTPFVGNSGENNGSICDTEPWLPECGGEGGEENPV